MIVRKRFLNVLISVTLTSGAISTGTLFAETSESGTSASAKTESVKHESARQDAANSGIAGFIADEENAKGEKAKTEAKDASTEEAIFQLPDVAALKALGDLDPEMRNAAIESMREYYRYRESGYKHRKAVFEWQLTSSKIIFWVVIVLVAVSIYFSGVQFHIALRSQRVAKQSKGEKSESGSGSAASASGLQTSIEAGSGGVKVSSPVLGVIILVISLLFFYLYLVHIYPISEIW